MPNLQLFLKNTHLVQYTIWSMIKNGALEELSPYLEENGIQEDYFNGSKTAAEVARVIEKRVQVYLDENR